MEFLEKNMPHNTAAIAEFLEAEKREGRPYPVGTTLFWQTWAKVDAEGALAYLQGQKKGNDGVAVGNLMKAWAYYDPAGAAKAFEGLADSSWAQSALWGMMDGLAGSDPAGAVDFAMRLPGKFQAEAATQISAAVIRESTIEEAQAWFDALPNVDSGLFPGQALFILLENMSRRCDAGAVEKFVMDRQNQAWAASTAQQSLAAKMILRNGGSPWNYLSQMIEKYPDSENPLGVVTSVPGLDPTSGVAWANANPDHRATDTILASAARMYFQNGKPEEATALLERIKDPALRDQAEAKQVVEKR